MIDGKFIVVIVLLTEILDEVNLLLEALDVAGIEVHVNGVADKTVMDALAIVGNRYLLTNV